MKKVVTKPNIINALFMLGQNGLSIDEFLLKSKSNIDEILVIYLPPINKIKNTNNSQQIFRVISVGKEFFDFNQIKNKSLKEDKLLLMFNLDNDIEGLLITNKNISENSNLIDMELLGIFSKSIIHPAHALNVIGYLLAEIGSQIERR